MYLSVDALDVAVDLEVLDPGEFPPEDIKLRADPHHATNAFHRTHLRVNQGQDGVN